MILGTNNLTGEIPISLYSLNNLEELHLRDTQMSGGISELICQMESLEILTLHESQFSGTLPSCFCDFYVSGAYYWNSFCGPYPDCLPDNVIETFDTSDCPDEIYGCTDSCDCNYNPDATMDNGSCSNNGMCYGCIDEDAREFVRRVSKEDDTQEAIFR